MGYEAFKRKLIEFQGGYDAAVPKRTGIYIAAASMGEFVSPTHSTAVECAAYNLVWPGRGCGSDPAGGGPDPARESEGVGDRVGERFRTDGERGRYPWLLLYVRPSSSPLRRAENTSVSATAGFVPILAKQIPYAVGQFTVFEFAQERLHGFLGPEGTEKMQKSAVLKPVGDLGCGIFAGAAAAVFSQPGGPSRLPLSAPALPALS